MQARRPEAAVIAGRLVVEPRGRQRTAELIVPAALVESPRQPQVYLIAFFVALQML